MALRHYALQQSSSIPPGLGFPETFPHRQIFRVNDLVAPLFQRFCIIQVFLYHRRTDQIIYNALNVLWRTATILLQGFQCCNFRFCRKCQSEYPLFQLLQIQLKSFAFFLFSRFLNRSCSSFFLETIVDFFLRTSGCSSVSNLLTLHRTGSIQSF